MRVCKELQTGAVLHRCRDGADGFVRCSLLIQQVAEYGRERFLRGDLRVRDAVDEVELRYPMEVAGVALGGRVTLALFRDDMQEVRAGLLMDAAQDPLDFLFIVAVKGAVVMEAHILKHGGVVHGAAHHGLAVLDGHLERCADHGHVVQKAAHVLLGIEVAVGGAQTLEVAGQRTHIFGDGHLVVVQNDEQIVQAADVVHSLVDHAAGKGTVADEHDHLPRLPPQLFGPRNADADRQRSVAVAGNEGVVFTLVGVRETGQAVELAELCKALAAAGQQLVRITLVAHIEHDLVLRGRKDAVQRYRQLHSPQVGGQMATGLGYVFQ